MENHYLKAVAVLRKRLPDLLRELDQHETHLRDLPPMKRGTPKKARGFAVQYIDDLIERLLEAREDVAGTQLKHF
jgi:hypothetical protein